MPPAVLPKISLFPASVGGYARAMTLQTAGIVSTPQLSIFFVARSANELMNLQHIASSSPRCIIFFM
eukprot:2659673-Lingulodinium_polyedra.AAC.1